MTTILRPSRPLLAILLAAAAVLAALAQPDSARSAGSSCADANLRFKSGATATVQRTEAAIVCLTNEKRMAHDLDRVQPGVQSPAPLVLDSRLAGAARKHSEDMAARDYFAHDAPAPAPNGVTLGDRVVSEGYCDQGCTRLAENILWKGGTGSGAPTPRQVVASWMNSPGHRANILDPDLREIGVGAAFGTPSTEFPAGGTYTQVFGTR
jgi:uncharacterized protein YkwD